jgi:pyruvate dehydrogenase E1 component
MSERFIPGGLDSDPKETKEWLDALRAVIKYEGPERAELILSELLKHSSQFGLSPLSGIQSPYCNTIPVDAEEKMPDDGRMMTAITNYNRWNAIAMVMRGGKVSSELGGHLSSYAATALIYEVGFNYFFHAKNEQRGGDMLYIQGHSSPGIYARAFLEGRISETQIAHFRQEIFAGGVSSYPHPWLMPDFWQFPTVSMGLGPLMSIYQARFLKYLANRGISSNDRKIWTFCGDGEMGEPESLGALYMAAREELDNLIFVISANLQRLDGPVYGNGQIIQELEGVFRGAGWNVIKVIWGSGWDRLFAKDKSGLLLKRIGELIDGEYQGFASKGGEYLRENFFGKYPELLELVSDLSDEELKNTLQDGGNDPQKLYAAYAAATRHVGQPTVILVKTVKGYGMGPAGEGLNITHQTKKMDLDSLKLFRDRFSLPLTDEDLQNLNFKSLSADSSEHKYLMDQRKKLGGFLPERKFIVKPLPIPPLSEFSHQLEGSDNREISTTMAFVRLLTGLLKDKNIKDRIVPIVADEARTFGMEGLFRQIGIYSHVGQKYVPEDRHVLMYYREDQKGQLLQEGISEAGAMSSWIAAATSYSHSDQPMIPFYIYYSMFGFQRFGDLVWLAGDIRARGFILGATAGRTTLAGEGLQHQDGHNLVMFGMVPSCVSYDPTFAYELAVIIQNGMQRMYGNQEDVFYYITLMNENYSHPPMPAGVKEGIIKGMYLLQEGDSKNTLRVQLLGSGTILREVIKAAEILLAEFKVSADIWSVTSFNELRKESESVARLNRLHPDQKATINYVSQCLDNRPGPVIAATDYIKLYAEQIRQSIKVPYVVLGTDGYGRSDSRTNLRDFFEVDAKMIAYTALTALHDQGNFSLDELLAARKKLMIAADRLDPSKA